MDIQNILSTHDVIQTCVKNEHATCNAYITKKGFKTCHTWKGDLLLGCKLSKFSTTISLPCALKSLMVSFGLMDMNITMWR
jgi:hypothetical protein